MFPETIFTKQEIANNLLTLETILKTVNIVIGFMKILKMAMILL